MGRRKNYASQKGRKGSTGGYFHLPHAILNHIEVMALSHHAKALLVDLGAQYTGYNNGDLSVVWAMMSKRGWKSKATLYKAVKELIDARLILVTQKGAKKRPTLYAFTWREINQISDEISVKNNLKKGEVLGGWNGTKK